MPRGSYDRTLYRTDLTGQRFGKLVALSYAGQGKKDGITLWLCRCDCGTERVMRNVNLYASRSCGCSRRDGHMRTVATPALNALYSEYVRGAAERGFDFALTKEAFTALTKGDCYYCGKEPSQIRKGSTWDVYTFNGIDSKINSIGYTEYNTVSCCKMCNRMKNVLGDKEFVEAVLRMADHLRSTGHAIR